MAQRRVGRVQTREGPAGDRPGPQGGSGAGVGVAGPDHPLQPCARASGARFAVRTLHFAAGWVPGIALPVYPPWYHPGIPTRPVLPAHAVLHAASSAVRTASLDPSKENLGVWNTEGFSEPRTPYPVHMQLVPDTRPPAPTRPKTSYS